MFDKGHPDFGPQIAVWVESADGAKFVDTLMVTNAVAVHGIGNRPGTWNLRSGPRFPYGRRPMALPIWGHARGKLYDLVVMEDGRDDQISSHEDNSSPEPYFCRPMVIDEVVDAISCPSGRFRSCKGRLATPPQSYFPPRSDLFDFGARPCMALIQHLGSCDPGDSADYAFLNDVDTVAAATPPYGAPFSGTWVVPDDLPDGNYALLVEVGKEFDDDAAHAHASYISPLEITDYDSYGQDGNVGQPSVLYRVSFTLGSGPTATATATTTDIAGYGDFSGVTGDINVPDATISTDPGSGAGRLLILDGEGGPARIHVTLNGCPPFDCGATTGPTPVSFTVATAASGTDATLHVHQSNEMGAEVLGYEARYSFLTGPAEAIDPASFSAWTPAGTISIGAPDAETDLMVAGLTPLSYYAVGIRARGVCGLSAVTFRRFLTPAPKFTKLAGCFVATAAFGSDLAPEVATLRTLRDAVTAHSVLAQAAVALYYRASPPLASLLATSGTARALVRTLLRIF